jgi:tetratricopeptide (TPR) repeat protein
MKKGLRGRGWVIAVMALSSFVVVLYIGFDAAYERLATLSDQRAEGGRMQIVEDIASAWTRFPTFGVGLGTHEVVYPMFDRSTISALAAHAENEYAQAGEETGAVGLLALLMFAFVIWRNYFRSARCLSVPMRSAVFGLGFGLVAILIHSLSDFGQHLPANAALSATFCGLLLVIYRMGSAEPSRDESADAGRRISRWIAIVISVIMLVSLLGALGEAEDCRQAEAHWNDAMSVESKLREVDWLGSNAEYAAIIAAAENAAVCDPGNVKYRHWLSVYRWRSISRVVDPKTGKPVLTPRGLEFAQRIVDEMADTLLLCPTFGATHSVMGQLEWYVLEKEQGKRRIRVGFELAPCDPVAGMIAADLDVHEGKIDAAFIKLRRVVEIDGSFFVKATKLLIGAAKRPDVAIELAGDDYARLFKLEKMLRSATDNQSLAAKVRRQAIELLKALAEAPDAKVGHLASVAGIYEYEKDTDAAIEYYRRALNLDYGQVGWRLKCAKLLADAGEIDDAIHEARICLRLRPHMAAARKLIEELSVQGRGMRPSQ